MSKELGIKTSKKKNFSKWYLEVIEKAEILDTRYGVKGFQIFLPTGMLAIDNIVRLFEDSLQERGHMPCLFPTVIPQSYFKKESVHIKGFENEVFWITHAGKNKLDEKLVLRPTSETAMYPMYALWIRSYTNLPFKLYQKGTVYRYETKMTKPLIRGREFYWIEDHTAQKSWEDAEKQTLEDSEIFKEVVEDALSIPYLFLKRPEWDKFPGADNTYAFETVLPDGLILQIGTTHNLGRNFSKVFKIKYTDKDGKKKLVSQTSYGPGISRILASVIAIHGDDRGLIFPPTIAPIQIVIIPIFTNESKTKVYEKCAEVLGKLEEKGFRVHLDDREQYTPGFKFHEWELRGVPIRIEIGPKDIEKKQISIVRRDFLERIQIEEERLEQQITETLDSINYQLSKRARESFLIQSAKDYDELKTKLKIGGFIKIPFCMRESCAKKLKEKLGIDVRGTIVGKREEVNGKCIVCKNKAKEIAYVGRSY